MTTAVGRCRDAGDRILRLFAAFTCSGYLFYLCLLLPSIIGQADRFDCWWTPVAVTAVFGTGFLFGLSTLASDGAVVRAAGCLAAITYLIALATGLWAWHGPDLTDGQAVWLSTFPGVASLAAATAWRPAIAFGHMIVGCAGAQYLNWVARDSGLTSALVPDIVFTVMFCSLFVGAAVMALRTGRIVDSTMDATHATAAAAAASYARTVERERIDAMIHDGVMSTLLLASRHGVTPSLSTQAAKTLQQFDALRAGPGSDDRFGAAEIVTHLRIAASDVDEGLTLDIRRGPGSEALTMPADTVRAIGAALAEALRNSIRHAGPDAERSVTVRLADDHLGVEVTDTGCGFDPRSVPPHRLGLAVSITGRMAQQPGGSAQIDSRPAAGTRVHLGWSRP
ncbi:sensor histidine kinase [Rhodococcus triatomae]